MKQIAIVVAFMTMIATQTFAAPATRPSPTSRPTSQPSAYLGGGKARTYDAVYKAMQTADPAAVKHFPRLQFGIIVTDIHGPLAKAGINDGDILLRCGDTGFKTIDDFKAWLVTLEIGKPYVITVMRNPVAVFDNNGQPVLKQEKITVVPEPKPEETADATTRPTDAVADTDTGDSTTHVGPKGGEYHYSKNGKKVYQKH